MGVHGSHPTKLPAVGDTGRGPHESLGPTGCLSVASTAENCTFKNLLIFNISITVDLQYYPVLVSEMQQSSQEIASFTERPRCFSAHLASDPVNSSQFGFRKPRKATGCPRGPALRSCPVFPALPPIVCHTIVHHSLSCKIALSRTQSCFRGMIVPPEKEVEPT